MILAGIGGLILAMDDRPNLPSTDRRGLITEESMALAIYGTMAAGLALAIGTDARLSHWAIVAAVLGELFGFFLAHAYADMLSERFVQPGTRLWQRVRHACSQEVLLFVGGIPVVVVFVFEIAVGLNASLSANLALGLLIVLLGTFGVVAARRAHATWPAAFGQGVWASLLGALVLVLKLLLH